EAAGGRATLRAHRLRGRELIMRPARSEEHTSELQSLAYLVCRLLLGKKVFGSDGSRDFKPDPEAYLAAFRLLSMQPRQFMLCLCHIYDLACFFFLRIGTPLFSPPFPYGPLST